MKGLVGHIRTYLLRNIAGPWFILLIALFPATAIGIAAPLTLVALTHHPFALETLENVGAILATGVIYALFLAPVFSVLALPLLPFQRWIVGARPPYLRFGYLVVVLYGPGLLLLVLPSVFWLSSAIYEAIALAATLLFVPIADAMGFSLGDASPA